MSVGQMVLYTLNEHDAEAINTRRRDFQAFQRSHTHPHDAGQPGASGHQAHVGNDARSGDEYPALIVREFTPGSSVVNLQVFLDGNDSYWATSRGEGEQRGPGRWVHMD